MLDVVLSCDKTVLASVSDSFGPAINLPHFLMSRIGDGICQPQKRERENDIPVYEEFRNFDDSNHLDTVPEKWLAGSLFAEQDTSTKLS